MNGSFLNDKKVQLVASWAAIHDPSLSSSPLSVWLLSQESDSTLIDTWQRLGAYGCLRALGRQKVHTMHLSPVTDAPLIVREQRAVWRGDDQHLGDLSYFYKHIQPQEAQAALSYETFYTRFSAWLELRHQVCCLEDSPVGMVMFIPDGLALPALADLWQVFVRHVFSGVELQKTFMLLLNSISLADRGFSVPELPLITRAQVDLMLAFFYATLHAIEQRLKRLDHEATATTKETALKKLNERRLSQHATYDGALLHFQAIVEQLQLTQDGYQRLEHIRILARGFAPQATRQLTATGNVIRKAATYMEWLLNLPEDALLELPLLFSREPIVGEVRVGGDQITERCYACGRAIPATPRKAYQKQGYKANKLILQSPSQALQGHVQESRPEICVVCAALALACPIKLSVNKGIVVSLSDYTDGRRPERLYEQHLRMLTIGEQNITAGRYLMIPCTEQAPKGDPLIKHFL